MLLLRYVITTYYNIQINYFPLSFVFFLLLIFIGSSYYVFLKCLITVLFLITFNIDHRYIFIIYAFYLYTHMNALIFFLQVLYKCGGISKQFRRTLQIQKRKVIFDVKFLLDSWIDDSVAHVLKYRLIKSGFLRHRRLKRR